MFSVGIVRKANEAKKGYIKFNIFKYDNINNYNFIDKNVKKIRFSQII